MTRCERFEDEALLLLEQDLPLDEHFSSCPDCRALRASYERLRGAVSGLSEKEGPADGWQARVWERIERRRERRGRWPWWLAPAAAVAALLALFTVRAPVQGPPGLRVEVESAASVRRGVEAHPGDLLRLAATTAGSRHTELRVYRNDSELILSCSTEPPCSRDGGELRAAVVLDGVGRYQSLLLVSGKSLPASASDLETDTRAALAAGADVEMGTEVVVR
jgi:hypothetical protein